jgi:predicted small lipoprotein YifL
MKKLTALLLAALMITMAACGAKQPQPQPSATTSPSTAPTTVPETEPTTQPITQPTTVPVTIPSTAPVMHEKFDAEACASLLGTWKTTVTMDKELLNTSYFTKKVKFDLFYTFNEDGSFAIYVDEEAFTAAIAQFESLMVEHMVERGYATFKADMERDGYGSTRIEELWAEGEEAKVRGETENFVKGLNLLGRFSQLLREGQYYVEDGRLYTAHPENGWESSKFKVKNGNLTLSNTDNPGIYRMLCINFPLKLAAV